MKKFEDNNAILSSLGLALQEGISASPELVKAISDFYSGKISEADYELELNKWITNISAN